MIQDCVIDADRFAVISECTETSDMEYLDPENEWVWNLISRKTVVYNCGAIGRAGETLKHNHQPSEIELCQRLAQEAASVTEGEFIEMGDEGQHEFLPFYVTANIGEVVPPKITEELIRAAFRGTIYPDADITIEPIEAGQDWWIVARAERQEGREDKEDLEYCNRHIECWSRLITWFHSQKQIHGAVFVSVATNEELEWDKGPDIYNGGCIQPRLIIGLTAAGSLAGVFSCVVYS
jgi:hypothetical protein